VVADRKPLLNFPHPNQSASTAPCIISAAIVATKRAAPGQCSNVLRTSKSAAAKRGTRAAYSSRTTLTNVHPTPVIFAQRARIVAFAIERRLPTSTISNVMVRDGLLMFYSVDGRVAWRRAASHVDRIFKGANPAELPVEQLDQFPIHHKHEDRAGDGPRSAASGGRTRRRDH
jgi:hypothetical protein